MTTPTAPRYAGLDGLRAVAVLLVALYHLFPRWFLHSGFVGVDVFFVISGFLITSLLLGERARSGRIALRAFWMRRARRLLPALALVVTVSATAAWVIGGDVLVGLGRQVLGAATFSYNWVAISTGASYFSGSEPELFRNLWSLAVEEQFYVLWPLLLPVLLLVRARWLRVVVALALAAASVARALQIVSGGGELTRAYYGTDSHAFGILIGVALAFALYGRAHARPSVAGVGPAWGTVVGVSAIAGVVIIASLADGATAYPVVPLAASALTAVAIAVSVQPGSWIGRALDVAPLRWIGERSYGIYLWHWPLVVLIATVATGSFVDAAVPVSVGVTAAAVTLIASAVSYRWLERPVRRLGFRGAIRTLRARLASTPQRRFGAVAVLAAGALMVAGTTAAVAAAPQMTSSEAAVQAGIDALREASATPTPPATPHPTPSGTPSASPCGPGGLQADGGPRPAPTCADPRGRPAPPPDAVVAGTRVSAIGDSVMLASAPALLAGLPGIQIDAQVSRSMWAGTGIVESLAAQGALREYVVVSLGTNGPVSADALQEIYDTVGRSRTLVLVTAFAPRDWIDGVNHDLSAFAATHPGVVLADWSGAIAPHVDLLAGDQIHPGSSGGQIYASTVTDAIDTVENARAQVRYQIELIRWATDQALPPR